MTVLHDVKKEFADRMMDRYGTRLLRPADALDYVSRCAEVGVEVLGIDGFIVDEDKVQPRMEHSLDLTIPGSDPAPRDGAHQEAAAFLKAHLDSDLWFEVVVEE